jgi:hypothetical protein
MYCYICAKEGKQTPALAVCLACGMCMCMDHLVVEHLPIKDVHNWGLSVETITYPETIPRFLCQQCHTALLQKKS